MSDFEYMTECLSRDIILLLMERRKMDMADALRTFYGSDTYAKLSVPQSGLYFQSPQYVYDFLDKEISLGRMC
jgi:hypothetical protein